MDLQQRINLNLAILAVLSATLVGLGEPNMLLPAGMILAAAASLWFCDHLGQIVLDRWVINLTVLGTAAVAAWRFSQVGGAPDAAVAADGLIALQAVMMFERKTARTHWDLFSLSLLQAFLSCAFNHGPLFAVMLVIYVFFVLSALALLGMQRQRQRCCTAAAGESESQAAERTDWWQVSGVAATTLLVGPLSLYLRFQSSAQRDAVSPRSSGSEHATGSARARVDRVPPREPVLLPVPASHLPDGLGGEFWWRIGRMTFVSLLIGAGIFFVTPRFGGVNVSMLRGASGAWRSSPNTRQRTVGFDDQVQLGELGATLDNTQRVLAVRFRRHYDNAPYPVYGDLFLRGAVLNRYGNGRWRFVPGGADLLIPTLDFDRRDTPAEVIRQEFRLEPLDRPELFCLWPSVYVGRDDRVQFDPSMQRFHRAGSLLRRPFAYELATAELVDGRQTDLTPALGPVDLQSLSAWPAESLPSLAQLAGQWLQRADVPGSDPMEQGRALERALRSSPRFSYRLGEQTRDQTLDPIEDFIVNDPRGHCEYFASALTLMLRSQGLPARMVIGFKTDEYNYVEERYWARQSHAHAWVEAYIPPESVPADVRDSHPLLDWSHGGWLRLDPTPSSLSELSLVEYLKQKLRDWQTKARTAWTQHVLQMSGSQQNSMIYRPLLQTLRETASRLGDSQWWTGSQDVGFATSPRQLFAQVLPWIIGCMFALGALAWWTVGRWRFGPARGTRVGGRGLRPSGNGPLTTSVEFYQRWEALFQQCGLYRRACQTPREFARQAGTRLAEAAGQPQLSAASDCVIDAFYQVRFGGRTLDKRQAAAGEQALHRLRQAAQQTASKSVSESLDGST